MNRLIRGFNALQRSSSAREIISRTFAYRSDISPEVLYPNSKPQLYTPPLPTVNEETFNGYIPFEKLKITYSRSSGPGGQNGDKVDTKVDLRFHVQTADWIPQVVRDKMLVENKNQINKEGFFVMKSELTRYQHMNLAHALERLRTLIRQLEKSAKPNVVSEEKLEIIRRRQEKAARERLFRKRERSQVKADRRA